MEPKRVDKRTKTSRSANKNNGRPQADGAAMLLDRALPPGYLHEWTRRLSAPIESPDPSTQSVVVFRMGGEYLAFPTRSLSEVAEDCTFHSLPHRAEHIAAGLVNVRSEILICISLENLLELEKDSAMEKSAHRHAHRCAIVIEQNRDRFAFPVSEVCAIVRYHPRELKEAPSTLTNSASAFTIGMLSCDGRAVGCLDDTLLFSAIHRGLV